MSKVSFQKPRLTPHVREQIFAALTFVLLPIGTIYLIPNVWIPAWEPGGTAYEFINTILTVVGFGNQATLYTFFVGVFIGSSVLWVVDVFKRYQGLILWSNIAIGAVVFGSNWQILLGTDIWYYTLIILFGIGTGLQLGGVPLTRYLDPRKRLIVGQPPYFFKRSMYVVVAAIAVVAGVGLFEIHLAGGRYGNSEVLLRNLTATGLVLVPFVLFSRYQREKRIVCLGPARSGKSSLMGGLYGDCDNEFNENDVSEGIYEDAIKDGYFPDRTNLRQFSDDDSSWDVIQFSYVTGEFLFKRKQTITTIDYPGEALTGIEGHDENATEPISTYIKNEAENSIFTGWRKGQKWNRTLESFSDNDESLTLEAKVKKLGTLVRTADTIAFTLPLEDFLHQPIAQRPELLPTYCTDKLFKIKYENGSPSKITNIRKGETIPLEEVTTDNDTKYLPPEEEELGLPAKPAHWIGNGEEYYARENQERITPKSYLNEYKTIVETLAGTLEYDFVWVVTKADLGYEDFKRHFCELRGLTPKNGVLTSNSSADRDSSIDDQVPVPADIDHGLFQTVFDNNAKPSPMTDGLQYKLFSQWLKQRYLIPSYPDIEDWMDQSFEEYVYPVWFDLDMEGAHDFRTSNGDTLNGSRFLLDRLAGTHLEYTHREKDVNYTESFKKAMFHEESEDDYPEQGVTMLNSVRQNIDEYESN